METPLVLWVSVFKKLKLFHRIITSCLNRNHSALSTLQVETFRNGRALEFKDLCDGVFLNDVMLQM